MLSALLRSPRLCTRSLHYILQRDTDKLVPPNDVFIRTPDTAPALPCLNYTELVGELSKLPPSQILKGTFVVAATKRKERGVAQFPVRVKDTTVLAVCEAEVHGEAYESGATYCLAPEEAGLLDNVEEYDAVVCTQRALPHLRSLGRVLKTKMPHERRGTVAPMIQSAVRKVQLNVDWEMRDSSNHPDYYHVTLPLIKSDFPVTTIQDHVAIMFSELLVFCPAKTPKDRFIERVELSTSDGAVIHLDIREHNAKHKSVEETVLKKKYSREETYGLREAAKNKTEYLEEEKEKIGEFLENHWDQVLKQ